MDGDDSQSVVSVLSRDDIGDVSSVGSNMKKRRRVSIKYPIKGRNRPSKQLVTPNPKRVATGRKVILISPVHFYRVEGD